MIAIRAGFLGSVAYVLLIATNLLALGATTRGTSIAVLALVVDFTAHQQFEAYTLFNWTSGTVLAVLVFGFLLFAAVDRTGQLPFTA